MTDPDVLKRTRAGHRGVGSRKFQMSLLHPQMKRGLQETLDKLKKLDEDLLPHIDPGAIDKEIEDSEQIKDELFMAMARVDRALLMKPSPPIARGSATARPTVTAKLPKLTLKSFNGNLVAWTPFWDSFKSAVHDNGSLADIDKFSYLQSLLEGRARETIAGLPLTNANYSVAVDLLEKRFGSKEKITAAHMEALMSLDSVSSDHHVYDLRRLYDKAESNIRSLAAWV